MTPATLATLRQQLSGCELLIYADIGSRTVLAANGRLSYPQEILDALTDCAAVLLSVVPYGRDTATDQAILMTPTGARGFLRAAGDAAEAMCWLSAPDADIGQIVATLRDATGQDAASIGALA